MLFDVRNEGEVVLVQPAGRLDVRGAGVFRRHMSTLAGNGRLRIVVDLGQVEFVDSAGLAALVSALKLARSGGGDVVLAAPQDPVRIVFEITRLHLTFDIYEDTADAVDALGRARTPAAPPAVAHEAGRT